MKQLILTLILVTLVTPAICFGEWSEVATSVDGNTHYIDLERIRERGGYVYFWELADLLRKDKFGVASYLYYTQGDCDQFRDKYLSASAYDQPMGEGNVLNRQTFPNSDWFYPPPDSGSERILKAVCDYVKSKKNKK